MNKDLTVIEIRIKLLRDIKGITQEKLANILGVSQALINSWENGYADIALRQLVKLAAFYKVPMDYLIGLTTKFDRENYEFKDNLDLKYLGKKIRIIRKMEGLTQEEFANKIHSKRSSISYYESGKMMMSSADLKEICNTFGFSSDWCIGNTSICFRREKKSKIKESEIKEYVEI